MILILNKILIFKKFILTLNSIYQSIIILLNYFFYIEMSRRLLWNGSSWFNRRLGILVWFLRFLTLFRELGLSSPLLLLWRSSFCSVLNNYQILFLCVWEKPTGYFFYNLCSIHIIFPFIVWLWVIVASPLNNLWIILIII